MNRLKKEMKKAEKELNDFHAQGLIANGVQSAMKAVKRIRERGPLISVVKGLNAAWFRPEYDAGHVVQVKMENSQVVEALIYGK